MRDKLTSVFERLKAQPTGKATSPMMSQFRIFPQEQDTMLRAVQSEEVLIKYVEILVDRRGNNQTMGKGLVVTLASDVVTGSM